MWKISFRHIWRQKFYAALNLTGLGIGLACSLLMLLYLVDEFSYDRFHAKADRIYRINQTNIWVDNGVPFGSTGPNVGPAIQAEIPEVEQVTRIHTRGKVWLSYETDTGEPRSFGEEDLLMADSNFFEVFSFDMQEGDPHRALASPQSLVLTEETARRYFGDQPAMGQQIMLEQGGWKINCTVTGVLEPLPDNSHFHFDFLLSMYSHPRIARDEGWSWIWTTFVTYVVVKDGADLAQVKEKLAAIPARYAVPTLENVMNTTWEEYLAQGKHWDLYLQPLTEIRLYSGQIYNRLGPIGDIRQVSILAIVAALILLLSCINFMNLATARASRRAREVGVKKVLGAHRGRLIGQFMMESILFSALAAVLAVTLSELFIGRFNLLAGKNLSLDIVTHPWLLPAGLGLTLLMGILSGSYPAFYLTAFQPVKVLKGQLQSGNKSEILRNGLVTFQFAISIALIISTLLVFEQLNFTRDKDLGFQPDNLLIVQSLEKLGTQQQVFKEEVLRLPIVEIASISDKSPPNVWNQDYFKALDGAPDQEWPVSYLKVDADYLATLGVEVVEGRDFRKDLPAEQEYVLVNETAVRSFGWGSSSDSAYESPVGKRLQYLGNQNLAPFKVAGIFKDFHFWSLHSAIEPLAMFIEDAPVYGNSDMLMSIRLNDQIKTAGELELAIEQVRQSWDQVAPGVPFRYSFLDQDFFASFQAEQQLGKVLSVFTGLAIFIACLGLLGLTAFAVEQRTKEIGVRKILGAGEWQIVGLLTRSVIRWVGIAFILAAPISYFMIDRWLQDFAFHISIGPASFLLAGLLTLTVAGLTMAFHAWQAIRLNPVEALRTE